MFNYKSKIQNLRDRVGFLKKKKNEVQSSVDAAERNAEVIKPEVLEWLRTVDETMKEVDGFLDVATSDKVNCCYGICPNPMSRSLVSKRASKITGELTELQTNGTFDKVADPAPPVQLLPSLPVDFKGFGSRMLTKKNVLDVLKDNRTSVVGIYGVAGVGKTRMIEEIAEKVKVESLFDEVVVATLARIPDVKYIQDQITSKLGLTMSEKVDINVRAMQLEARLKDGEKWKRSLLILDELWQNVDFHSLGIPVGKDYSGVKVLFVSRNQEICYKMNAQKIFEVKALSKKEAWLLFKKTAGIPDDTDDDLAKIAKEIASECGGLPLAIIAVAKALRNKPYKKAWNDALRQFATTNPRAGEGLHNLVYTRVELSFNYMENDAAKLVLLLCCLFPEEHCIPIEHLVRYGKGLNVFKSAKTLSEIRGRVDSVVEYLEECCLLLASGIYKCVKLHDVVRDVCLSVASREEPVLKAINLILKERLEHDSIKTYNAISMRILDMDQLPSTLECPELKLLWLLPRSGNLNIPKDFFEGTKELRVLNINKIDTGLPSSLQLLSSLRALCLDFCKLSTDIALIGKLKDLEILSFFLADVDEIPTEMVDLRNIELLDFRFGKGPYPIPSGILSGLKKLEELYFGDYFQNEEKVNDLDQQLLTEIVSLSRVRTLQISMTDSSLLLQVLRGLRPDKLERFHISRKGGRSSQQYQFSRSLELLDIDKALLHDPDIVLLLKRTEHLVLGSKGLKNLVNELDVDCFSNLKKLELESDDCEYLVDATGVVPSKVFTNLESLYLNGLKNLKEMCKGNLPAESFSTLTEVKLEGLDSIAYLWRGLIEPKSLCNIKVLKMQSCRAIRCLFPESILKCLVQLQELDLADCEKLEEVISREDTKDSRMVVQLPKLKVLKLDSLSNIKSFCSQSDIPPSNDRGLQAFFNQILLPRVEIVQINKISGSGLMVGGQMQAKSLHRLRVMKIHHCRNLEKFATSDSIKLLQNLEQLEIVNCGQLKVVFDFEGLKFSKGDVLLLCHLEKLRLSHNAITHIWRMVPKGIYRAFQNLKYLEVLFCTDLRYFLSPSTANMLVSLEYLEVQLNGLKQIIGKEEEVSLRDETMTAAHKIIFPKLSCIILRCLIGLEMFSSEKYELVFPSLTQLHIIACPQLKKFSAGKVNAPMLKKIHKNPEQIIPVDLQPV